VLATAIADAPEFLKLLRESPAPVAPRPLLGPGDYGAGVEVAVGDGEAVAAGVGVGSAVGAGVGSAVGVGVAAAIGGLRRRRCRSGVVTGWGVAVGVTVGAGKGAGCGCR
jgi:hypothetical protein